MTNLTFERVVKLAPDLNPVVGHDLVIFEKIGAGKKPPFIVRADEQYQEPKGLKAWLSKQPDFVAYAVNMDESLALDFTRRIQPDGNSEARPFDLEFKLRYRVTSSETVVRRLLATTDRDPLARLQDGICEAVSDLLANTRWDMIFQRFDEVRREVAPEALRIIEGLSTHLGLSVTRLNLSRRLLGWDGEHINALDEIRRKDELDREKRKWELLSIDEKRRLESADAGTLLLRQGVKAVADYIVKSAEDHDSAKGLIKDLRDVIDFVGNPAGHERGLTAIGSTDGGTIKGLISDSGHKLKDLLNSTIDCASHINCEPDRRKALVSAILHIVAELITDGGNASERARPYGEKLSHTIGELRLNGLPDEQRDRLLTFLNYEAIREHLR